MLISGHKTDSVYRCYNIIDIKVLAEASAKIEGHQRGIKPENSHRTTTVTTKLAQMTKATGSIRL
jgi:hypothetical protein